MKKHLIAGMLAGILGVFPAIPSAQACDACEDSMHNHSHISLRADDHAPIGVMGDHMHEDGEWMLSYRFMRMDMEGNRDGTDSLSNAEILATPNRFGTPPNLRVVPEEMSTNMHMIGGMYAPLDTLTLMLMANYIDREMSHSTYNMAGTKIGEFETDAKGWGDTKASALIRLYEDGTHHLHLNAGISLPTGSIKEEDTVLAPNGMTPRLRLPYAMQLGSGTYDLLPGFTYTGTHQKWGWGAQYMANFHLGENSQDYTWGDKHLLSLWGSYLFTPAVSASFRVIGETEQDIDGIDSNIAAPVQTADPDNYGGERVSAALGINTVVPSGILKGHRFSFEATLPVYQDLNGPQLERDHAFMLGWSKAF